MLNFWTGTGFSIWNLKTEEKTKSPEGRIGHTMMRECGDGYSRASLQGPVAMYSGTAYLGKHNTQIFPGLLDKRCHCGLLAWSTLEPGNTWSPGQCQLTMGLWLRELPQWFLRSWNAQLTFLYTAVRIIPTGLWTAPLPNQENKSRTFWRMCVWQWRLTSPLKI